MLSEMSKLCKNHAQLLTEVALILYSCLVYILPFHRVQLCTSSYLLPCLTPKNVIKQYRIINQSIKIYIAPLQDTYSGGAPDPGQEEKNSP